MGDLLELTTVPKQQNIYYKVTSGSLRFQVKGQGNAGIGFSKMPSKKCDLWFVLGCQGCTEVVKHGNKLQSVPTRGILSSNEFREFWIQWQQDTISLGRDYDSEHIVFHKENKRGLIYVTFATLDETTQALNWKLEVPPLWKSLKVKPVFGGAPKWVKADDELPEGALIGGYENEVLYIIRAKHRGSLTPGKFMPSEGVGYISWGGEMHEKTEFEVLCGYDCMWMPCSDGRVPVGAVEAGHSEGQEEERLYVGRANCYGDTIPGKVQPSHKVCYIPYNYRENAMKNYEVLVVPHNNLQCTNPFFLRDAVLNKRIDEDTSDEDD